MILIFIGCIAAAGAIGTGAGVLVILEILRVVQIEDRLLQIAQLLGQGVQRLGVAETRVLKILNLVRHIGQQIVERGPELALRGLGVDAEALGQTLQIRCLFHNCHDDNLQFSNRSIPSV